jgi:multiple sugar transport system permease protein
VAVDRVPPVPGERLVEPQAVTAAAPHIPGRERSEQIQIAIAYAVMFAVALLFFVPFVWSVSTSFKTLPESVEFTLIPDEPTLAGYREALTAHNFGRYIVNSALLASIITVSNVFLASLGGYAFARLRFPGREVLFFLVLGTLMVPDQLRLVPVYTMLSDWALVNTYQGYILIYLVQATALFLMRQYFLTIPRDLEEAAKLDGAGYFKTYWRVMLPLAGPALAAVTILVFQGTWNEFFWALILLQEQDKFTIPLGIAAFSTEYDTRWPPLMAASVLAILPIAFLYVLFQRYFVAGVAASGVKG